MNLSDTIVALSTAPGVGAIAVVRMSGLQAIAIADIAFKGKILAKQQSHTAHYGRLVNDDNHTIDEVVVTLFKTPHSYTKQDTIEISCHGSPYISEQVIKRLLQLGARPAEAGEFTLRAFLNGGMDLSQAEAVADLISAESAAGHELAIKQLRGGVSEEIKSLRGQLVNLMSLLELELDFSEEDVEFADRKQLRSLLDKINNYVGELINSFSLGNAIKNGVVTVIAGRPNAGKSTLLNALVNDDRAIVSEIAGTTRDTIEEVINVNGVQVRLIDTAGIREAKDQIEAIGVQKTLEKIGQSTILIYVFDVTKTSPEDLNQDLEQLPTSNCQLILAANKMDLDPYLKPEIFVSDVVTKENIISISAKNKMNIAYLKNKIFELINTNRISGDQTILSNIRHYHALTNVSNHIQDVYNGLDVQISSDLIAQDIRQILHYLGEITGEVTNDEVLGNIFSKFCIGK